MGTSSTFFSKAAIIEYDLPYSIATLFLFFGLNSNIMLLTVHPFNQGQALDCNYP
jgi:hypothetical protein